MTVAPIIGAMEIMQESGEKHPVMAYIAAKWPNFCAGKTAQQKKMILGVWEAAMQGYPMSLLIAAINACAEASPNFPPSSAEVILEQCNKIQRPMNAMDAKWYADMAELEILDAGFCAKQIAKYKASQAAGRNAYAGWD